MRPEAGWYPDPSDTTQLRWWDGRAWTQERTSAEGAVPVHREESDDAPETVSLSKNPDRTTDSVRDAEPAQATDAEHVSPAAAAPQPHEPAQYQPSVGYPGVAMAASGLPLAGQGMRLLARIVDWALLGVIQFVLAAPFRGGYLAALAEYERSVANGAPDPFGFIADPGYSQYIGASALIGLALTGFYEVLMVRYRGATLGKMMCRIKVVSRDGGQVGWGQALGRWFTVYPLAQLSCYLFRLVDGAWCLFDADRDCLHDKMSSTQVVVSQR